MVSDPAAWAPAFAEAGADTILVHEEATYHYMAFFSISQRPGLRAGVVVNLVRL